MKRTRILLIGAGVLLVTWTVAAVAIAVLEAKIVTAQKVLAFVAAHPLEGKGEAERARIIEELAEQVNRLPFEERQKMRVGEEARVFYSQMTDEERMRFIHLTMEEGLRQALESFNKMTPLQRQRLVGRAMREFREVTGAGGVEVLQQEVTQRSIEKMAVDGLQMFMGDTGTVDSVQMQMFLEQLQHQMRSHRPRRHD
jgi:hypothetical protein